MQMRREYQAALLSVHSTLRCVRTVVLLLPPGTNFSMLVCQMHPMLHCSCGTRTFMRACTAHWLCELITMLRVSAAACVPAMRSVVLCAAGCTPPAAKPQAAVG